MQVGRLFDDDFRRFHDSRAVIAPVASYQILTKAKTRMAPVEEIRLDVLQCCSLCGFPVRQNMAKTGKLLCQDCRCSDLRRQSSLEDIRPVSPMTVQSDSKAADCFQTCSTFRAKEDVDSFRSMEVLTCFRSEVRRGLRLLSKAATAEKWHMCWAILLSMCLVPLILTLMVVAGMGLVVLSTWVTIAAAILYPLAYINPRLYNYAMNS
ncbi:hypothetical protein PC129_g10673 [Phytophthora cactorum]|uniref:Transmembrane protein n=1 Tax=Phytophthora cactorum TaxID=29920 RepID=A0A8T1L728_9STRA|nr:hypothetical protein PC112_g11436 [Phytophthora cactorum]KAG2823178.1 hypothetical protein PC111_g10343 [Phytophthora cactorum]KAG2856012.1 hypothetical protein PC113_g11944 [Phytophthora cactorum]KAG2917451.1 hypothetical protein PC115_g10730 [Phytophthora cactorum]KAG2925903.1 hypothetical protein PC114_g3985 [Phytophthora cactorum]